MNMLSGQEAPPERVRHQQKRSLGHVETESNIFKVLAQRQRSSWMEHSPWKCSVTVWKIEREASQQQVSRRRRADQRIIEKSCVSSDVYIPRYSPACVCR